VYEKKNKILAGFGNLGELVSVPEKFAGWGGQVLVSIRLGSKIK
jgi:hypothetical protein